MIIENYIQRVGRNEKKKKKKKGDTNIRIFFKCIKVVTIFPASNHNDYALRRGTLQREIKFLTNSITSRAMHAATETFQPREKRIFFFFFPLVTISRNAPEARVAIVN